MKHFYSLSRRGQVRRLRDLVQAALLNYGLHSAQFSLLSYRHNTLFQVDGDDGARYALRIQRPCWGTVESIRSELAWLAALRRETDLIAPSPVATCDGDPLTVAATDGVPEPRICVLFDWFTGRSMNDGLAPHHLSRAAPT